MRPTCKECHGTHGVLGKRNPSLGRSRPISPTSVPAAIGEGKKAAVRYTGREKEIIEKYSESIHGKGLVEERPDGDGHVHGLPHRSQRTSQANPESSVNAGNVPATCGNATRGSRSSSSEVSIPTVSEDRQAAAGLQRLPQRAHDQAGGHRRFQAHRS